MSVNVLITGAAGYIGGSLVNHFSSHASAKVQIFAAVRSDEQLEVFRASGVNVLKLDLADEDAVVESVQRNNISIVINTASSLSPTPALNLITALGKQRAASGREVSIIHTSGLSAFYEATGWPQKETKDGDDIFGLEKQTADSFAIRKVDVTVIEQARLSGVTSFTVVPSIVYGKGSGPWNKLSIVLPVLIKGLISRKSVTKFPTDAKRSGVHITDLVELYAHIVGKVVDKEDLPSNEKGYYFGIAHALHNWEVLRRLAERLKARDLITSSDIDVWPDYQAAADALGVPVQFVGVLWDAGDNIESENARRIGWSPKWDEERFFREIDQEIDAVVELGTAKSSLIDSLWEAAAAAAAKG